MTEIKRVKYCKCPLIQVVYQLNFPTILAIDEYAPVKFQDAIREYFPKYKVQTEQENEIKVNLMDRNANPVFRQNLVRKLHQFISEDGDWTITLSKNLLSISTGKYDQWECMVERFKLPLEKFVEIYKQNYFDEIALRYVDAFNRPILGLDNVNWTELINPHLQGCLMLGTKDKVNIVACMMRSAMNIGDIVLKVSAGLGSVNGIYNNKSGDTFILDCEYSVSRKIEYDTVHNLADDLHYKANSFFRESITTKLHKAMVPEELKTTNEKYIF